MKSNKIILLAVTLMAGLATASAQLNNAYFLRGATERYTLNPALSPNRGYFAIPALGLTTALESNFLSADNFLFPAADGNGLVTYMHSSHLILKQCSSTSSSATCPTSTAWI